MATNSIARNAVLALKLLAELSKLNRTVIPLAWEPSQLETVCAIVAHAGFAAWNLLEGSAHIVARWQIAEFGKPTRLSSKGAVWAPQEKR